MTCTKSESDKKANQELKHPRLHRKSCPLLFGRPRWFGVVFLNPCPIFVTMSRPTTVCTYYCHQLMWHHGRTVPEFEVQNCNCRKPACISWWGLKGGGIFHTHRSMRSLSSGWVNSINSCMTIVNVYLVTWSTEDLPEWESAIRAWLGSGRIQALATFMFLWGRH